MESTEGGEQGKQTGCSSVAAAPPGLQRHAERKREGYREIEREERKKRRRERRKEEI